MFLILLMMCCAVAMRQIQTNHKIQDGGRIAFPIVQIISAFPLHFTQYTKLSAVPVPLTGEGYHPHSYITIASCHANSSSVLCIIEKGQQF